MHCYVCMCSLVMNLSSCNFVVLYELFYDTNGSSLNSWAPHRRRKSEHTWPPMSDHNRKWLVKMSDNTIKYVPCKIHVKTFIHKYMYVGTFYCKYICTHVCMYLGGFQMSLVGLDKQLHTYLAGDHHTTG